MIKFGKFHGPKLFVSAIVFVERALVNDDHGDDMSFDVYWVVVKFNGKTLYDEYFESESHAKSWARMQTFAPILTQ